MQSPDIHVPTLILFGVFVVWLLHLVSNGIKDDIIARRLNVSSQQMGDIAWQGCLMQSRSLTSFERYVVIAGIVLYILA